VIISDKLSKDETLRLLTILEKHRSAFCYSLEDFKGISPALCTHHIRIDLAYTPSWEPQRGFETFACRDNLSHAI
jgi:hypothetical protein